MTYTAKDTAAFFRQHKKVLAVPHAGPDGDAAGCMAAVGYIAQALGAEARLYCATPLPELYSWLSLPGKVHDSLAALGDFVPDLVVLVDCATASRTGREMEAFFAGLRPKGWKNVASLCIDHHQDNTLFATHNWVEPKRGATAELIGLLAEELGIPLRGELAEAIYFGLVEDTGNFTYSSTSASLLTMAARIVEDGLDVAAFTEKSANNWSLGRMQLWGELMLGLTLHAGGRVASVRISNALLKKHQRKAADLEGFVSWLRHLQGVQVSLLMREKAGGAKASLRSMGDVDVRAVAALFGGGGHVAAAGVELPLPLEAAEEKVLEALLKAMDQ